MKKTILLLPLALTACANLNFLPPRYEQPTSGPTATIQFYNSSKEQLRVTYMSDGERCKNSFYVNGVNGISPGQSATFAFSANQKVAFKFYSDDGKRPYTMYCVAWRSTTLVQGVKYVASYNNSASGCQVGTGRQSETGEIEPFKFLDAREYSGWLGEMSGWCKSEK